MSDYPQTSAPVRGEVSARAPFCEPKIKKGVSAYPFVSFCFLLLRIYVKTGAILSKSYPHWVY